MSRKSNFIFAGLILLSFLAFIFVNTSPTGKSVCEKSCHQPTKKEQIREEEQESSRLAVPDLTLLQKALQLVGRFAGGGN